MAARAGCKLLPICVNVKRLFRKSSSSCLRPASALAASRAIPWTQRSDLADHIRRLNTVYRQVLEDGKIPTGALLTVGALPHEMVQQQIDALDPSVVVAMHNCRDQLVLYGTPESIEALSARLIELGGI